MYGKTRAGIGLPSLCDAEGILLVRPGLEDAALEGRLFGVCNQAAVATTAALTGAWTGLCVSNPSASGKNMILHEFGFSQTVAASADGAVGIMTCTIAAPGMARIAPMIYATSPATFISSAPGPDGVVDNINPNRGRPTRTPRRRQYCAA